MGKASGINYMAQRFGTVFALAIGSAVFSAHGHLGSPAAVTAGFRPALWACAGFAVARRPERHRHHLVPPSDIAKGRGGRAANRGLNPKDCKPRAKKGADR